jgi:hypothetical protein
LFWTVHHDHALWTGELKFHGESYGWEAIILREGELVISQRFVLREHAVGWSEEQRRDVERGWVDG